MRQRSLVVKPVEKVPMKEIPPNAGKTIAALRELGYDSHTALCDILDNSIDAGAKSIWVTVKEVGKALVIDVLDDGAGMDEPQLIEALRIGSDTGHNANDLGKFGIGLKTAGMSLARCILVISRKDKGTAFEANLDLDLITRENRWVLPVRPASAKTVMDTIGEHGTLVRLSNIDRISDKNIARFTANLRARVGQTYRHYIAKGMKLYVNNRLAVARDPLMLEHPLTRIVLDTDLDLGDKLNVHVKAVELPELTMAEDEAAGILPHASGFYVLRNGREIVEATTFGFYRHHHSYSHFRCEISFAGTPEMDKLLHVDIKKGSIHPERTVLDKLQAKLGRFIADSGRKGRDRVVETAKLTHAPIQVPDGDKSAKAAKGDEPASVEHAEMSTSQGKAVEWCAGDHGADSPFVYPSRTNGKLTISYNRNHPLWVRLSQKRTVDPLFDYLVFSLAYTALTTPKTARKVLADVDATLRGLLANQEAGT